MRKFLHGYAGETITLWAILKEFAISEIVTLLRQLAYCDAAFRGGETIDEGVREQLRVAFNNAGQALLDIGLETSVNLGVDFTRRMMVEPLSDDQFSQSAHNLFKAIQIESYGIICFKTDEIYTNIFDGDTPFATYVRDRFPKAIQEIEEAAKCVLYERGTACVFHSMRAVEVVLKAAWKILGLPEPSKADSWGQLLTPIDDQLAENPKKAHPLWQTNRQFLAELVADVRAAKQAYRDSTMHVESIYTLSEARAIFNATKRLVCHAAKRLDQGGNLLDEPK